MKKKLRKIYLNLKKFDYEQKKDKKSIVFRVSEKEA